MGKSLGIAAFVLLLVSLPIPVVGNYISLLAALILCVAAMQGERMWVVTVDLIAWVKMFMLSPTWHMMMFGGGYMRGAAREMEAWGSTDRGTRELMQGSTNAMSGVNSVTLLVTVVILAAPIVILLWRSQQKSPAEPID